ncbi:MAG: hypothetical protein HYZ00_11310 [Candidatus Hydrogenedentes bacterium]|nr:hypothetical protein [Candidatus Hydrogenedentota bacterium]
MSRIPFPRGSFLLLLSAVIPAFASDLTVKETEQAPPAEVSEDIKAVLQPKAIQLLGGDKPQWEFWFVKELPLKGTPASPKASLDQIAEATLLGVVKVPPKQRDYRDDAIEEGVYTMRFLLQPQDGDHLGTAEFNYFAVLVPAAKDQTPGEFNDFDAIADASSEGTPTDHPVILSLRPLDSAEAPGMSEPAEEHKALEVSLPARVSGAGSAISAPLSLIFYGHGHL